MNIDKELEAIFDDPLLKMSEEEESLFDIPQDMRRVIAKKTPDYVAQHKLCENFQDYKPLFAKVHQELKEGKRSLVKINKTATLVAGRYYFVSGQMLLLEQIGELKKSSNFLPDARTRCIYENGTESDILLQTLRKNVVGDGYAISELQDETDSHFFSNSDIATDDHVTGYIYVLSSLSDDPAVKAEKNLYKIGFTTNDVEQRIANAENEPTYLMAPVKIVATYKVVNLNSQMFEDLVHQLLMAVQYQVVVYDEKGIAHQPQEWFVVPLPVVDVMIKKIMDGSIVGYIYEIIYYLIIDKELVNRGFLYGPYLPVYGFGAVFMLWLIKRFKKDPLIVFLLGVLITGIVEYITGYLMFHIYHRTWWDYTGLFLNINGYVCLRSVLTFGIGGLILIYVVDPIISKLSKNLNSNKYLVASSLGIFLIVLDLTFTLVYRNKL